VGAEGAATENRGPSLGATTAIDLVVILGQGSVRIVLLGVGAAYWSVRLANVRCTWIQILTKNNNKVDAVVASMMARRWRCAALSAQGLAGSVPVSGQDGDKAALNRVALGTQTVSVWKDARELGKKRS